MIPDFLCGNQKISIKIIDPEKLPSNFYEMSEGEKSDAVYIAGFNEENILDIIKENVPFLNVEKLKEDIKNNLCNNK